MERRDTAIEIMKKAHWLWYSNAARLNHQLKALGITVHFSGGAMKALKVMATIDDQGQLTLDQPLLQDKNSRVEVIVLIPDESNSDEKTKAEVLDDFRQAWHEAMTGQTIPVSQLWEGLEDD